MICGQIIQRRINMDTEQKIMLRNRLLCPSLQTQLQYYECVLCSAQIAHTFLCQHRNWNCMTQVAI